MDKGVLGKDEINEYYTKLINLSNNLKLLKNNSESFSFNITKSSIQRTLIDLYDYLTSKNAKKKRNYQERING